MANDKDKKIIIDPTVLTAKEVVESRPQGGTMHSPGAIFTTPFVLTVEKTRKNKKGRKRYTSGTKSTQRFLYGLSKGVYRVGEALSNGLNTFVKRSNKSAKKRRDGMLLDSLNNASRGIGRGFSTLGRAPYEIARRTPTRTAWKTFRVMIPFGN